MDEKIIISGRNMHNIDPNLHVWGFPIALYLFLGGLAAGILIFSAITVLFDKQKEFRASARVAPLIVPVILAIGLLALIIDLTHKTYVWRLYTTIRLESPMSWGAWVLMVVTPLSALWAFADIRTIFPRFDWKFKILYTIEEWVIKYRKMLAWILIPLATILGIYTGILLSAFNARPLWNTAILGPLFLVSGLSTAAAVIIIFSKSKKERNFFSKIDIFLIIAEIALIIHFVMAFLAGSQAELEAVKLLLNGEFTTIFIFGLMFFGLIFPLTLELLEQLGIKIPAVIPAIMVLIGGLLFRIILTDAGQLSSVIN